MMNNVSHSFALRIRVQICGKDRKDQLKDKSKHKFMPRNAALCVSKLPLGEFVFPPRTRK